MRKEDQEFNRAYCWNCEEFKDRMQLIREQGELHCKKCGGIVTDDYRR